MLLVIFLKPPLNSVRHASLNGKAYDMYLGERLSIKDMDLSFSCFMKLQPWTHHDRRTLPNSTHGWNLPFRLKLVCHGLSFEIKHYQPFPTSMMMRSYIAEADLKTTGAKILRPFHLPHRLDYGLRGTSDVDWSLVVIFFKLLTLIPQTPNHIHIGWGLRRSNMPLPSLFAWMVWPPTLTFLE